MVTLSQIFRRRAAASVLLALSLPLGLVAQQNNQRRPQGQGQAAPEKENSYSEKTAEAFGKLRPLMEAKDFDGILKVLDAIPNPTPYDQTFIQDMRGNVYLNTEQYSKAIAPKEEALKLADAHGFFTPEQTIATVNMLARLIFADAVGIKDNNALQQQLIAKASGYFKRFLDLNTKKVTGDDTLFYAQLLYAQAIANPQKIDMELIRQARQSIENGLLTTLAPKDNVYTFLASLVILEENPLRASEILELTVQKFPQRSALWEQLMASYNQLAVGEKNERAAREYYARAINTIERAQQLGFMKDPKNNYNLVTFYVNAGQPGRATDILHDGLRKATIESTVTNWRILGDQYRQANKDQQAVDALLEGAKLFPKEALLEMQAGDLYRGMDKIKEARDAYRRATQKVDSLTTGKHVPWQNYAYAAMELEDWAEAHRAINEAAKFPEFAKDVQMVNLKGYIDSTVERMAAEAKAKAEEAAAKQNPKK